MGTPDIYIYIYIYLYISKFGIQNIIQKYNTEGLHKDKKHSERPTKLSKRSKRIIRRISLGNRAMSIRKITSTLNIEERYMCHKTR